jgi:hypothetical protein
VNVGVIVRGLEGVPFEFRFLPRAATLRRLWPDADQRLVTQFERRLQNARKESRPLGEIGLPSEPDFFDRARHEYNGNLQITEVRGHRADQIGDAIRGLYATFVAEPSMGSRPINYQAIAPTALRNRVWTAFEKRDLLGARQVRKTWTLDGKHAPWTFDMGYENGALNLISAVALNAPTTETNLGRALVFKGMVEEVKVQHRRRDIHGTAVVQLPSADLAASGAKQAVDILHDAEVAVVPFERLANFVESVAAELGR